MRSAFPSKKSHSQHSASFSFSRKPPHILLQFCRSNDSLLPLQRSSSISSQGRKIALAWGRLSHQVTLLLCQLLSFLQVSVTPSLLCPGADRGRQIHFHFPRMCTIEACLMTTKKPLTMSKEEWASVTDVLPGEDSPPPRIKSSSHHATLDLSAATTHPTK